MRMTSLNPDDGRTQYHCDDDRPIEFQGLFCEDAVFIMYADDGCSYTLTLTKADMAKIAEAARGLP